MNSPATNGHKAPASLRTIQFHGRRSAVLFDDLLRPLTEAERSRLREKIGKRGRVLVPAAIDADDGLIDGINRLELAVELDLPADAVTFDVHAGLTFDEKRDLAAEYNEDRRHLTPEDRKALHVKLIASGLSKRAVAEQTGASQGTVRNDTKCLGAQDCAPRQQAGDATKVTGRDGKTYPAGRDEDALVTRRAEVQRLYGIRNPDGSKLSVRQIADKLGVNHETIRNDLKALSEANHARPIGADEPLTVDHTNDETAPEVLADETDADIPTHLEAPFRDLPSLRRLLKTLDDAARDIEALAKSESGVLSHCSWQSAQSQVRNARKTLFQGRPSHVCPYCQGQQRQQANCQGCRGHGFVCVRIYSAAPPEMQQR